MNIDRVKVHVKHECMSVVFCRGAAACLVEVGLPCIISQYPITLMKIRLNLTNVGDSPKSETKKNINTE